MISDTAAIALLVYGTWVLPFISFIISIFLSPKSTPWFSSILLTSSTLCSFLLFINLRYNDAWPAIHPDNPLPFNLNWLSTFGEISFRIDHITVLMGVVVTSISTLVHVYSIGYMTENTGRARYFALLGFFTFSMLGIVFSNHLLFTFIFWELVGFSSYLLIGHWREKPEAGAAATKAFIFNRIGDAGFLIGIGLLWAHTGSLNYSELYTMVIDEPWMTWISLGIFCGITGKSAQFPLSTWLPDAMEGPTPVSALIHAATMVAAGVFLLIKIHFLFSDTSLIVVGIVGSITALWGAWGALSEFDIKKILAYSTVSQLGFMILGLSSGYSTGSTVHLFTHAFFKAGLFLSAGAIIHHNHQLQKNDHFNAQDIRNMNGLSKRLPIVFISFLVSGAALAGIPLFSGFISKDIILTELFNAIHKPIDLIFFCVALLTSLFTVMYTYRMIHCIFFNNREHQELDSQNSQSQLLSTTLLFPIIVLAIGSTWLIVSNHPFHFSGWLRKELIQPSETFSSLTVFSVIWVLFALLISFLIFRKQPGAKSKTYFFSPDLIYYKIVYQPVLQLSKITSLIDRKWIDRTIHFIAYANVTFAFLVGWCDRNIIDGAVNGTGKLVASFGTITRSFAKGKIQSYIVWAMILLIIFYTLDFALLN